MLSLLVLLVLALTAVRALKFEVEPQQHQYMGGRGECFSYRVGGGELAVGRATLLGPTDPDYQVGLFIYGTDGSHPIALRDISDAPFSFKANELPTDYSVCLRPIPRPGRHPNNTGQQVAQKLSLSLVFKSSHDLFDEHKARDLKLKPLEAEFYNLQAVMKRVADDMARFLQNEERMRDVNESSLERVTYFSVAPVVFLVGLGLFQLFHLKRFFIARKLI